jgi:hypothetical protein
MKVTTEKRESQSFFKEFRIEKNIGDNTFIIEPGHNWPDKTLLPKVEVKYLMSDYSY